MQRSQRAEQARTLCLNETKCEMRALLEACLVAYEIHGVDELALTKISDFLRMHYSGTNGAKRGLGEIGMIKQAFMEIQTHLYAN